MISSITLQSNASVQMEFRSPLVHARKPGLLPYRWVSVMGSENPDFWRCELCRHGPACGMHRTGNCWFAHSLAELLPPRERDREYVGVWRDGVDRYFGQHMNNWIVSNSTTIVLLSRRDQYGLVPWHGSTKRWICVYTRSWGGTLACGRTS